MWRTITHPFLNCIGDLSKPPLKLGHVWVITFRYFTWINYSCSDLDTGLACIYYQKRVYFLRFIVHSTYFAETAQIWWCLEMLFCKLFPILQCRLPWHNEYQLAHLLQLPQDLRVNYNPFRVISPQSYFGVTIIIFVTTQCHPWVTNNFGLEIVWERIFL